MWQDFLTVGLLVLLEGVLSADNALVLAILVRHLPERLQKRALLYGLGGALLFRGIAILLAKWILQIWWLQGLGALYLAYMTVDYFRVGESEKERRRSAAGRSFWMTVVVVELTDIAFAVDSIMVAVALSRKLWVVYTGAVLGTILMRLAANAAVAMLRKYPATEGVAYVLIGWTAVKLGFETYENFGVAVLGHPHHGHILPEWLFWTVLGLIVLAGSVISFRKPAKKNEAVTVPE